MGTREPCTVFSIVPSFEYTSFVSLPPSRVASQQAGLPPARPLGARGRAWQQAGHLAYSHPAGESVFHWRRRQRPNGSLNFDRYHLSHFKEDTGEPSQASGCEQLAQSRYATARSQRDSNPRPRGRWSSTLTTRLPRHPHCLSEKKTHVVLAPCQQITGAVEQRGEG